MANWFALFRVIQLGLRTCRQRARSAHGFTQRLILLFALASLPGCHFRPWQGDRSVSLGEAAPADDAGSDRVLAARLRLERELTLAELEILFRKGVFDRFLQGDLVSALEKMPYFNEEDPNAFAFVGRLEARADAPALLTDKDEVRVNGLILPPLATARLVLQLKKALLEFAEEHKTEKLGLRYQLSTGDGGDAAKYMSYFGNSSSQFRFARCEPRFDPQKYSESLADMAQAFARLFGRSGSETQGHGVDDLSRLSPESDSDRKSAVEALKQCGRVFSHADYTRWELDFLLAEQDGSLFQEVHVRTREGWAYRLFHGPLDGHNELARTVVFRRKVPFKKAGTVHLRVFGNVAKPQAITFTNLSLAEPFDTVVRDRILENIGIPFQNLQAKFLEKANELVQSRMADRFGGLEIAPNYGTTLLEVSRLFEKARVWNFISNAAGQASKLASVPVAWQAAQAGLVDLQGFETVDLITPSAWGGTISSFMTHGVVPWTVLFGRAIDATEVDYFIRQGEWGRNARYRAFVKAVNVFDAVLAGTATAQSLLVIKEQLPDLISLLNAGNIVRLLNQARKLYAEGPQVSQDIYSRMIRLREQGEEVPSSLVEEFEQKVSSQAARYKLIFEKHHERLLKLWKRTSQGAEEQKRDDILVLAEYLSGALKPTETGYQLDPEARLHIQQLFAAVVQSGLCAAGGDSEAEELVSDRDSTASQTVEGDNGASSLARARQAISRALGSVCSLRKL